MILASWRSVGIIGGLCATLGAPAAWALPGTSAAGPRPVIDIPQTTQDGGTVEEGTVAQFRFTVANRGQADLVIAQVKPSCGCTVSKWEHTLKPGAELVVEARMNTEYFRGSVAKHLTVISNDPARPQIELTITAQVTPLVKIEPAPAALLSVNDQPVTQEFTLERTGGQPMKIVQVIPNAPYLQAEATPLPGEGRYRLRVTATTAAPLGRTTIPVVVRTDMPKGSMLTLVLTIDRGIVTVPPMVFYGLLPHEMKGPAQAMVSVERDSPAFHVKSVGVDDPHLTARVRTVRDGAEYHVIVVYSGGWDSGMKKQTLTIMTDDPKQPKIEIPVQAVVQATAAGGILPPVSPPLK